MKKQDVGCGMWEVGGTASPTSYLLPPTSLLKGHLKFGSLNKPRLSLISLIILLIISVDNSVDKLWISCGWSCG
jgi:hypothetical protein